MQHTGMAPWLRKRRTKDFYEYLDSVGIAPAKAVHCENSIAKTERSLLDASGQPPQKVLERFPQP